MLDSIHAWLMGVPDLLIRAVAAIAACIGVSMLLMALFSDALRGRGRNRRRCPKCWYDMSGSGDSLRCPECGHQATVEAIVRAASKHGVPKG